MKPSGVVRGAGRQAVSDVRDGDWESFVKAVHGLPTMRKKRGPTYTWVWADTELRSLMDTLALSALSNKKKVRDLRRVHALLCEGVTDSMSEDSRGGMRARGFFLRTVERLVVAPTLRAAFARSIVESEGYTPVLEGDNAES